MTALYVFSTASNGGHRAAYNAVFEKEFKALGVKPVFVDRLKFPLFGKDIFFTMIEETPASFVLCALANVILGGRTVGLLFRPGECFRRDRLKHRAKYLLLRLLRRIATVRVLTILPFSVDSRFAEVADDWIYDPQLWDSLTLDELSPVETPLSRLVQSTAKTRRVIVALGAQNRGKGLDWLCDLWMSKPALGNADMLVVAGAFAPESQSKKDLLRRCGALVIDRHISAQELQSLYGVSALIWAAYHPDYNQASGVAGRAFQFGVPVVVRKGSLIARLMRDLDHSAVEIQFGDLIRAADQIESSRATTPEPATRAIALANMRARSLHTLTRALGARAAISLSAVAARDP